MLILSIFLVNPILSYQPVSLQHEKGVKDCINEILIEQSAKGSKISDQQISALLQEKYGVSIARRTVAKYRKELDIRSSYNRM